MPAHICGFSFQVLAQVQEFDILFQVLALSQELDILFRGWWLGTCVQMTFLFLFPGALGHCGGLL